MPYIVGGALIIGLTLFKNRNNVASVWFFRSYENVNVLKLMLMTAVGAVAGAWVLLIAGRLWLEYRGLAAQRRQARAGAEKANAKKRQPADPPPSGLSGAPDDHTAAE